MFSLSDIRREARSTLGGNLFGGAWLYGVLVLFIVSVVGSLSGFIPLASLIISGPIAMAQAAYFLNRVRGRGSHEDLGILVDSAKDDLGGNILLGFLEGLFIGLWTCLFIIPGIVKAFAYSMAFYVKRDNPNMTATEAITESRRLMDGYKWKYFLLQLSFIGWYIVGTLCLGIGSYWVSAYNAAANAAFYERIVAEKNGYNTGSGSAGGERPLWESVMNGGADNNGFSNPFSGEGATESSKSVGSDM